MKSLWIEIAGWSGALLILLAYALIATNKLHNRTVGYHSINLIGALLLMYYAWQGNNTPFVLLNAIWSVVAVYTLLRLWTKKATEAEA